MDKHLVAQGKDVVPGRCHLVSVGKLELGLFRVEDGVVAYRNICPHAGAPICQGRISGTTLPSAVYQYEYGLERQILRCPWHGWEFDLATGAHLVDADCRLRSYPVIEEGGEVFVLLRSTSGGEPPAAENP